MWEHLLTFCTMNELCVINTTFAKKRIYQYSYMATSRHEGMWHCIDYVLMRHSQRHYCSDAEVFCSAECWTDHKLVCATLGLHPVSRKRTIYRQKRFNVGPLYNNLYRDL